MDILDKAYDYIDYTLVELAKVEESCVSLLYYFKLFSPAGELAKKILLNNSLIAVENSDNLPVICITEKGREVVKMGGVREYIDYMDGQVVVKKRRVRHFRKTLAWAACIAGAIVVTTIALRK